jgi:RNA polymerase sigma-70 factor, ECF subfamily
MCRTYGAKNLMIACPTRQSSGYQLPSHFTTAVFGPENNRKISEHFPFSGCPSLQRRHKMAGQAILGDTVLKSAIAMEAAAPTVETLVADHFRMVFRIAYSILRNHHDAEDAAQECFLRVWKQKDRLSEVSNAKTWLARIAWTTALDKRRSSRAMVSLSDEQSGAELAQSIPDLAVAADQQLASAQMQQMLERLIVRLPEDLRSTLELSTVQELNSAEIAEVMKIPEGSVRTRLFRARKQLKEKLTVLLEVKKHG